MSGYQNILCAMDFSAYSDMALLRSMELAKLYKAKLTLLHVVEYFPEDRSNAQIPPEDADPAQYREQQALALLSEHAHSAGIADATQAVRVTAHSAKQEIIAFANEQHIDLIVVASHGRHGIAELLGSTANGVLHKAACDVLVVRASA